MQSQYRLHNQTQHSRNIGFYKIGLICARGARGRVSTNLAGSIPYCNLYDAYPEQTHYSVSKSLREKQTKDPRKF